ncbi:Na(+)-translocating NADH-quinone reductase subunit F [Mesoflavibacter sp. CH_XMU1404-2]|uniref:Na(+)-translocating NADH-quinone reductase subunit F n=1 Tax=Mesoflavibacter sp. CH_XMU1404-2 TaxID=3107766 RepID=UPI0030095B3D
MKTTKRFENAINKLYIAFNENTLNPECCKQCAVGNILDQKDAWKHLSDDHGSLKLNYLGLVHQNLGRTFNGYSPLELLKIEAAFLRGCGYELPLHHKNKRPHDLTNKNTLFNGLNEAIKVLCIFDNIEDVTNYSNLFKALITKKRELKPINFELEKV